MIDHHPCNLTPSLRTIIRYGERNRKWCFTIKPTKREFLTNPKNAVTKWQRHLHWRTSRPLTTLAISLPNLALTLGQPVFLYTAMFECQKWRLRAGAERAGDGLEI
uniref:Uncharacterized protein n=1 Tax=Opuntia streptacantha TaxID=393608 RepID=A0A7C9D2K0_OPUST